MDAARKIFAAEGFRSFFKGAGANILRGVAGAGVLSIYDRKFQPQLFEVRKLNLLTSTQRSNSSSSARPSKAAPAKSNTFQERILSQGDGNVVIVAGNTTRWGECVAAAEVGMAIMEQLWKLSQMEAEHRKNVALVQVMGHGA
jgi:hypothetical protein